MSNRRLWVVSAPNNNGLSSSANLHHYLQESLHLASVHKLTLPQLRVGTLDSLISVSDTLSRDEPQLESVVDRILRQYRELSNQKTGIPFVEQVTPLEYVVDFEWDEAKFGIGEDLGGVRESIMNAVHGLEEDLKIRVADYSGIKQAWQAIERKDKGSLMVKHLGAVVREEHVVLGSEHLVTVFVVVGRYEEENFLNCYEGLCQYVVPRSAKKIEKDQEYVLYGVTVFKKGIEEFKSNCRDKRFTVRDFKYDPKMKIANQNEAQRLNEELNDQHESFTKWSQTAFAEAFIAMIHLKAVRAFVESVLRYGLPIDFEISVLVPKARTESKLRNALNDLYGHLGGSWAKSDEGDDVGMIPGIVNDKDFYPYVYLEIPIPKAK